MVLPSLDQFSIRYHTLGTTNAHIIDDLKIVGGRLDRADIIAAGVKQSLPTRGSELVASEALRFAQSVDTALRRGNIWQALRVLDELRWRLQELFAISLGKPPAGARGRRSCQPGPEAQAGRTAGASGPGVDHPGAGQCARADRG